MHTVGDRTDRDLLGVEARPQAGEHLPADDPVQPGDPVGALGQPQAHVRHVEHVRVGLGAELEHPLDGHAGPDVVRAEVAGHQVAGEPVDPGRYRGVGGEQRPGPSRLQRLVEAQAGRGQLPDALQAEEAGMALVGVEHLRLRGAGHRRVGPQRPHPADAQQHLLEQAMVGAAAVEPVGHAPLGRLVVLDVGVEQQQRHPTDLRLPDLGVQGAPVRQPERDLHGVAGSVGELGQRQAVRVDAGIAFLLPAVPGQRLDEVAGPVEQAHPHDRHAQVAGGLKMVAGEDAEPAGVLRQHLGDAELRREVGDRARAVGQRLVPARRGQVLVQVVSGIVKAADEAAVGCEAFEALMVDLAEKAHRVPLAGAPQLGIDRLEEIQRLRVPRPAKVEDELPERVKLLGELRADGEASKGSHEMVSLDSTNGLLPPGGFRPEAADPAGGGIGDRRAVTRPRRPGQPCLPGRPPRPDPAAS